MPDLNWLAILMRWVHILSACLAIGGPFFMRFVVSPAAGKLEPAQAEELRKRIMSRWKHIVYLLILAFFVSGFYNFFAATHSARFAGAPLSEKVLYQALFGIKFMLALPMFVLASALSGRAKVFEPFRARQKFFTTIFLLFGVLVIVTGGIMRQLPTLPHSPPTTTVSVP